MAGGARLNRTRLRLLGLLALVLLVHALALHWLAGELEQPSILRPLAPPMFTRLLQPQAPTVAPLPQEPAPQARQRRPAITSVTRSPPAQVAAAPKVPASAPQVPPEVAPEEATVPPETAPAASAAESITAAPDSTAAAPAAAAAAASAPAPASLDSWPVDTRLNYRLSGNYRGELTGSARVQWQRDGSLYQTRVDIEVGLLATLALTSQGDATPTGLMPRAYEETRRSGPRGVRLGAETITFNDGRKAPRPPGVQDTASQFVELSHRFATGREVAEVGRSVSLWMARPGAVDLWTYDIVGKDLLQSPEFGAFEAFHLKPRPIANPRGNITAEMWFAPTLQYLPARIRVNMGDAYVDLMVVKIEQR